MFTGAPAMIGVNISDLDGNQIASAPFHDVDRAWEWVAIKVATKFHCRERDVDCLDDDDSDHNLITARGRVVARVYMQGV